MLKPNHQLAIMSLNDSPMLKRLSPNKLKVYKHRNGRSLQIPNSRESSKPRDSKSPKPVKIKISSSDKTMIPSNLTNNPSSPMPSKPEPSLSIRKFNSSVQIFSQIAFSQEELEVLRNTLSYNQIALSKFFLQIGRSKENCIYIIEDIVINLLLEIRNRVFSLDGEKLTKLAKGIKSRLGQTKNSNVEKFIEELLHGFDWTCLFNHESKVNPVPCKCSVIKNKLETFPKRQFKRNRGRFFLCCF